MDIMQSISFDSLPVFFRIALYFCGGCLALILVGLCIIGLILTFTGIMVLVEDFVDDLKESKKAKKLKEGKKNE